MTPEEFLQHARACTHFLSGHFPCSVRDRLLDIADSPYAELRADHYGNGGFVTEFEQEIATLLGKEAAVIMPSGTMAQPIALRIWADRAKNPTVAFHPTCHLELHEHNAYQELHHLKAHLLGDPDRLFTLQDLQAVPSPYSTLLVELPQREIGGPLPTWNELQAILAHAKAEGAKTHLDGARLWESQPYYNRPLKDIVANFDSVYVSFYKLLFGLPGAALAGPADFIAEARIWMRRQGGNLVNMFPSAISAKIGLDRYLPQVPAYVAKAAEIAEILNALPGVAVLPHFPPTTMMHVHFQIPADQLTDAIGHIAKTQKLLLLPRPTPTPQGAKVELNIGSPALQLSKSQVTQAFQQLLQHR